MEMLILGLLVGWMIWGGSNKPSPNVVSEPMLSSENKAILKRRWPFILIHLLVLLLGAWYFGPMVLPFAQSQLALPVIPEHHMFAPVITFLVGLGFVIFIQGIVTALVLIAKSHFGTFRRPRKAA